ncbi:MAG: TetR/AcrR family transcriptional regulator [Pseudomonas sp.]|uniref:TetR/AcrR family transcriptional regulator n=1 Tax=Pseudomonas sp. TaxID=306 RepID=UPI003D6DB80B
MSQLSGGQAAIDRFLDTRNQALSLFASKGYRNVGMRELASALGINCGSLYNHIESKEALLFEFFEELYELLRLKAERIQRRAAPGRLRAIIEMHLELHTRMPCHFQLVEREWPSLSEPWLSQAATLRHRYEQIVAQALDHPPSELNCESSVVTLLNQAPAWLLSVAPKAKQRAELVHGMVQLILNQATLKCGPSGLDLTD